MKKKKTYWEKKCSVVPSICTGFVNTCPTVFIRIINFCNPRVHYETPCIILLLYYAQYLILETVVLTFASCIVLYCIVLYCIRLFCLCVVFHVQLLYDRICGPTGRGEGGERERDSADFPYNDRQDTRNIFSHFPAVRYWPIVLVSLLIKSHIKLFFEIIVINHRPN